MMITTTTRITMKKEIKAVWMRYKEDSKTGEEQEEERWWWWWWWRRGRVRGRGASWRRLDGPRRSNDDVVDAELISPTQVMLYCYYSHAVDAVALISARRRSRASAINTACIWTSAARVRENLYLCQQFQQMHPSSVDRYWNRYFEVVVKRLPLARTN